MNKKLEYRLQIALYFIVLGVITFVLLYLTAPSKKSGKHVRVLHISYAEQSMTTTELKATQNVVVINLDELNLSSDFHPFYKNNIVLECNADFPITWDYEGYGIPPVEVHNTRKFSNFHDTSTYSYTSLLNLMPISETSSGQYYCSGLSPENSNDSMADFVQLFIPGPKVFVLQQDIIIQSDVSEELLIPCQVSDPLANISLLLRGEVIDDQFIKSYHPARGFALNAKFMEENDPLSTFVCQDRKTKRRSGKVTVSLKKGSIVLYSPPSEIVNFSNEFNGTFACHAKENVTLKFRRIQIPRRVEYSLNLSSEFGFKAVVNFEEKDLIDGTVISCLTVAQGSTLHTWTVSLSKREEMQTTKFLYKEESDEYACCGTPSNRPKFKKLTCHHPIECRIQHNCLTLDSDEESKNCDELNTLKLSESGLCINYKVEYTGNISTGQVKCGSGFKTELHNFMNVKTENGTVTQYSGNTDISTTTTLENLSDFLLGVETIYIKRYGLGTMQKHRCKAPKFAFSAGFVWQVVRYNGLLDYYTGKDYFDGPWIISEVEFEDPFTGLRQAKKIYCIAPIWNSDIKFVFKFTSIVNILDGN